MIGNLKEKKPKYYLSADNEFVIENYNFSRPFANFFPGIAGKYGIPMWVFYVNRGQAITSFGTKDKDHAILEFFPANKAWQLACSQGFRTFIKLSSGKKVIFYEPFHNGFANLGFNLNNRMGIASHDLKLEEENLSLGLKINVEYFTVPGEPYAALARIVTIKNTRPVTKKMQVLDGLPQIVPYGVSNLFLKKLGRTIESWMKVENLEQKVPFYKLDVDPTDRPEVVHITEGNFYLGFHYDREKPRIIRPIVEPQCVFGTVTDFSFPHKFLAAKKIPYPARQVTENKTPSGFLLLDLELSAHEEKTFYSVIGHMRSREILNSSVSRIIAPGYLTEKREENKKIIRDLQRDIATVSNSLKFNLYAQQTYLDNILRGGYPVLFSRPSPEVSGKAVKTDKQTTVFYIYSRKHGDLERDYNKFQIQPAYLSQGNGNYRDMNQNRRCDVWFNPDIEDENIISFFNLLQTDGFNPLVIKGVSFTLKDPENFKVILKGLLEEENDIPKIISFLTKPATPQDKGHSHSDKTRLTGFTPGEAILFIEEGGIRLKVSYDEFLGILLNHSLKSQEADHGEGFWIDHWTYNLDLLESYLGVYPEKLKEIIFDKRLFTFYDNPETVKPRCEKYILKDGIPRQLHALKPDNAKREMIKARTSQPHTVRTQHGKGQIYQTTLLNKLLCLAANKLASLDPFGTGMEMEADKPNWFDSLNGLPALFGSSSCETFELKRLILFIKQATEKAGIEKIHITEEIRDLLIELGKLLRDCLDANSPDGDYQYWDKSYALKEDYRKNTRFGLKGQESEMAASELIAILDGALSKIDSGIKKAYDKEKNIYYAYFINEALEFQTQEHPFIKPTKFIQKKVPFYLESQFHAMKLIEDTEKAKELYEAVKKSELFDRKLKMYKVTASLSSMPEEIGRCRVFTPGWLENESIWLHMEYKYMLECLKRGLYKEFYADFKNALIPFLEPKRYGRSILENSSFIVSSVFPDKDLHGAGYVARLSGSTAEFLNIWLIMNVGTQPFLINDKGELNLKLSPALPMSLFTQKDKTYSFNFLGKIWVAYHNPRKKDTFGNNAATPKRIIFNDKDGNPIEILSDTIPSPFAEQIRARQVNRIDVFLE